MSKKANSSSSLGVRMAVIILVIAIAISLNATVLWHSIPETKAIDAGCCAQSSALLARDFSAFYFAVWNLFHNSSAIYSPGYTANASFLGISPHPESFKYLPSFIFLVSPFLLLSYGQALYAFDALQFAMLALIAFLVYGILAEKNTAVIAFVLVIALLLPFSTNANWTFSEAYFWQWAEGQSKVLDLTLILLGLYFGKRKRPNLSGIFFALSFFDPEMAIVALPLYIALNKGRIVRASVVTVLTLLITNVPLMILPGVGSGFFQMLASGGASTPLYYYSYIPLLTVAALSGSMWKEIGSAFSLLLMPGQTLRAKKIKDNNLSRIR